jgi:hypothetical protein
MYLGLFPLGGGGGGLKRPGSESDRAHKKIAPGREKILILMAQGELMLLLAEGVFRIFMKEMAVCENR